MIGLFFLLVWLIGIPLCVPPFAKYVWRPRARFPDPPHARGKGNAMAIAILGAALWPFILPIVGFAKLCSWVGDAVLEGEATAPDIRKLMSKLQRPKPEFAQGRVWAADGLQESRLAVIGVSSNGALVLEHVGGEDPGAVMITFADKLRASHHPTDDFIDLAVTT